MSHWDALVLLIWGRRVICRVQSLLDRVCLWLSKHGLAFEALTVKTMVEVVVVLVRVIKGVGVSWRVEMAVVRLLVATLWVVTTALKRGREIAMTVVPRLLVLPLTLVAVSRLLKDNFRR